MKILHTFLCLATAKIVFTKMRKIENKKSPFWLQKGTKNVEMIFFENIDFKLSHGVCTVFEIFFEQILCFDEVWSHMAKSAILVIFGEN